MDVDKFGINIFKKKKPDAVPITLPWCYLKLLENSSCLDVQHRNLRNISPPLESSDACTKEYVDNKLEYSKAHVDHELKVMTQTCSCIKELNVSINDRLTKLESALVKTKHEQTRRNK